MSRMFKSITRTWNVFVGCNFDCSYCNARKLALSRLKHLARYKDGFKPHLVQSELERTFKPGEFIFVAYMGDITWASLHELRAILARINLFPHTRFLICSKDPHTFNKPGVTFPPNVYLGTTIETNRDYHLTKAPPPIDRFRELTGFPHSHKFLAIEPIMDFDLKELIHWVELLRPDIIEVGADNYYNNLPEPSPKKLEQLLEALRNLCPQVIEKVGLARLLKRQDKGGN